MRKIRPRYSSPERYHEYMGMSLEQLYKAIEYIQNSAIRDKSSRLTFILNEIALKSGKDK
jgi:hypothetical protein